ncbi:deoxyribose-phosphate aldolase [Penaeicola halotolerans]|uniref:deoxyribose-phosphate aldolase n=1 Tax=Penaeicola halotolerans TaxID=2793196 RepID=UPI001CF83EE3|nr:deoxyribose-phosphate aldolase [Penaeicola halotolerans]
MKNLHRYIEQTNLKPTLVDADIEQLVSDAKTHEFGGICVPPFWVEKAKRDLGESDTQLVTVIGFPLGYQMTEVKAFEAKQAIKNGADELDLVWNISAFKAGLTWPKIEIAKIASITHEAEKVLKVIIETAYLTEDEIIKACKICADAGVDFVKTSTGFAPEGAQVNHIKLIREVLPSNIGIKASGGIKTYEQAIAMITAGADRLGTSSGVNIITQIK